MKRLLLCMLFVWAVALVTAGGNGKNGNGKDGDGNEGDGNNGNGKDGDGKGPQEKAIANCQVKCKDEMQKTARAYCNAIPSCLNNDDLEELNDDVCETVCKAKFPTGDGVAKDLCADQDPGTSLLKWLLGV